MQHASRRSRSRDPTAGARGGGWSWHHREGRNGRGREHGTPSRSISSHALSMDAAPARMCSSRCPFVRGGSAPRMENG